MEIIDFYVGLGLDYKAIYFAVTHIAIIIPSANWFCRKYKYTNEWKDAWIGSSMVLLIVTMMVSKTIYNYSPDDLILYGVIAIRCIMILALGYLIRRLWEKYTLPR